MNNDVSQKSGQTSLAGAADLGSWSWSCLCGACGEVTIDRGEMLELSQLLHSEHPPTTAHQFREKFVVLSFRD